MRALARVAMLGVLTSASACSGNPNGDAAPAPSEPQLAWSQPWGTSGDDFARSVAVDPAGELYASGYTDGAFEQAANAGSFDAFLTRWNADGSRAWTRQWGGEGPEFAQSVVQHGARVFVAGYSPSSIDRQAVIGGHDVFLTLFDADGVYGGTRQWGTDADDYVYAAAQAGDGVVVVGYTRGAFEGSVNAGEADAFVLRCDASGALLWSRQLGTAATDYAQAVHIDAAGNVLVAGYTAGQLGDDPDRGAEDAFLFQLSPQGELLWLRQWGSDTTDYALSVSSDRAGDVYVAGYTYGAMGDQPAIGGEDGYLTKLSVDGQILWTRQFGTESRDSARFVSVDARGEVLVGGDTEGSFANELAGGGRDSFVARFDQWGVESFRAQWGASAGEFALSAGTVENALYVAGYLEPSNAPRQALLTRWTLW
jgi:hypothetical protein